MRCVNPNVSKEEEISDSAEHHVPDFFFPPAFSPSSPHFWPTGQTADSFMADRERREDLSPNRMKKEVGGGMMGDDVS